MHPYEPQPRYLGEEAVKGAVRGPAIALMIVAGICLAMMLLFALPLNAILLLSGAAADLRPPPGGVMAKETQIMIRMLWEVVLAAASGYVIYGAIQMQSLRNYSAAYTACVVAAIPCIGPCCVLGIPFGIWGVVVLQREEVKGAFR